MDTMLVIAIVILVALIGLLCYHSWRSDRQFSNMLDESEKKLQDSIMEKASLIDKYDDAIRNLKNEIEKLKSENVNLIIKNQNAQYTIELNERQAKKDEQLRQERFSTELKLAREQMRSQFEKELQERSENFKQLNAEQMAQVVAPLQKELELLRTLVNDSKAEQLKNTSALEASIKAVFEHDKERDKTTQSLADALKNRGKVQGDWGEQVLENILMDSGLREGEEYVKQVNVKGDDGSNERPDVVVYSADGNCIIIDSKVSLTAYTEYVGAENDEERKVAIKANHDSIWQHVCELSDKQY